MPETQTLVPAREMAARSPVRIPNESAEYRAARTALLAEEIELRRQTERVAEMRRALPPGGEVTATYEFEGEDGPTTLEGLFADKDTLVAYSFMYPPSAERPCPMCSCQMAGWDGQAPDIGERVSLVVIARSPIERFAEVKRERGWRNLRIYSDPSGRYTRDYVHPEDANVPQLNVFTRRDGTIRHFWCGEMIEGDPGQDPRGDQMPIWQLFDLTPEGRGTDWYPSLSYA